MTFCWRRRQGRGSGGPAAFLLVVVAAASLVFAPAAQAADDVSYSATVIGENTTTTPTDVVLDLVVDVAVDSRGYTYVADPGAHRIYRIAPNGTRTVFAGTGKPDLAWNPEAGQADLVNLGQPYGLAIDAQDNVYAADLGRHVIVRMDPGGSLTVLAGNPAVAQTEPSTTGGTSPTTLAPVPGDAFRSPLHPVEVAVARDGTVYAADQATSTIVAVSQGTLSVLADPRTPLVETTRTTYPLYSPVGLAVRTDGAVLIADKARHQVYAAQGGRLTLIAGIGEGRLVEGPATRSGLSYPERISLDDQGNLYIADEGNDSIDVVDSDGTIRALRLSGYTFKKPTGITARGSTVLIADKDHDRIVRWAADALPTIAAVGPLRTQVGVPTSATLTGTGTSTWSLVTPAPDDVSVDEDELRWAPLRAGTRSVTVRACAYLRRACTDREVQLIAAPVLPGAPTVVDVGPGGRSLTVRWNAPAADGGEPPTGYVVRVEDALTGTADTRAVGAVGEVVVGGLTPGRDYSVSVAAVNGAGTGPASSPVTATLAAEPAPITAPVTSPTTAPVTPPTAPSAPPVVDPTRPVDPPATTPVPRPTTPPATEPVAGPTPTPTPAPTSAPAAGPAPGTGPRSPSPVPATAVPAAPAAQRPVAPPRSTSAAGPGTTATSVPSPHTVATSSPDAGEVPDALTPSSPTPSPTGGAAVTAPPAATAAGDLRAAPPATASATPPSPPAALLDRLPEAIAAPVRAVATVGVAVARHAEYPSAVFALAGFFLLAQRRIDRDDPKLALAPVVPDDRVPFETQEVAPW
ncbi:sugar lactone lactonase YvrE [Kineococcus radiotolerans]|uniref:Sugar lactone lactonase YvrE n=1 Tax=Kineococcus radiotolerans TaxID=131568 RepID=A0A7W4TIR8_KINRA|nr:fibronectin type III domain-containing protein [Kineococcus radiotolerans]MBB2899694.1 sugar lactone lactonase YvrE [Kineococcus radiotolerans]